MTTQAAVETDFAERLERFFRANYTMLVRRHLRFGSVPEVQDAIQEAMMRIYARFVDGVLPEPDNLDAFVNTVVRNVLRDRLRRAELVPIDDVVTAPDGGRVIRRTTAEGSDPAFSDQGLRDDQQAGPEDALAWKQLLEAVFDRLPDRWSGIAAMVIGGASPAEIGAAYDRNGYVLRRYTRDLICRILRDLAEGGDSLADAFGREFCS